MAVVKKLIFFVSLFLFYFLVKELLSFFDSAFSISPILGYIALAAVTVLVIWYLIVPIYRILRIPKHPGPVTDRDKEEELIAGRLNSFRENSYLIDSGFKFDESKENRELYSEAVAVLKKKCDRIRKQYVRRIFYGSTVSQNGFLDALLIMSTSVNLIRDTFILYAGRVSNRDLFTIGKMVYYSTVIGGSESVEYLTEEIFSKLSSDGLKGIPFLGRITGSIADGFVNAALLTRVSLITENYCGMTHISKVSDLYPKFKTVFSVTRHIVSGLLEDARGFTKNKVTLGILGKLSGLFKRNTEKDTESQPEMV